MCHYSKPKHHESNQNRYWNVLFAGWLLFYHSGVFRRTKVKMQHWVTSTSTVYDSIRTPKYAQQCGSIRRYSTGTWTCYMCIYALLLWLVWVVAVDVCWLVAFDAFWNSSSKLFVTEYKPSNVIVIIASWASSPMEAFTFQKPPHNEFSLSTFGAEVYLRNASLPSVPLV